jgi:integrase
VIAGKFLRLRELFVPIKTYLTPEDIEGMIASTTNLRDKVVLSFLSDTGVRVSELLAITPVDIDLDRQEVIIPHLKRGVKKHCPKCSRVAGRNTKYCSKCGYDLSKISAEGIEERTRLISIGENLVKLISNYLQERSEKSLEEPLINLTRQMVYKIVRDAAINSGLAGKIFLNTETGQHHYVHPHDFRSALAVSWLEYAGNDASKQKALQTQLGHKDFATTQRYNKLTPKAVRSVGDEVRKARFGKK